MRTTFTTLLFSILLISCSRDDDQTSDDQIFNGPLITNVKIDMNSTKNWLYTTGLDFVFQYDNQNRLIKKTGDFMPVPSSLGFDGIFTRDLYTSLVYTNNKVSVKLFSSLPDYILVNDPIIYTVNSSNQILEKDIAGYISDHNKKLLYKYQDNRLVEITTTYPNRLNSPSNPNHIIYTTVESFSYNADGNLTKTEAVNKQNGIDTGVVVVRTFENYDTSTNPTKRFSLLEDYFYRSLSKNNFRKYHETSYSFGAPYSSTSKQWTFSYDANGNIIIN